MLHSLTAAALALASSETPAPPFPLGGGIIWWLICAKRKQHAIGGWLLFYFWQVFSGAALAAILLVTLGYRSYSPEMFDKPFEYWLYFVSAAPGVLLLFVHAAAALILLTVRTWDVLQLLRRIVVAQVVFTWLGVVIDATKFQSDLPLDLFGAIQITVWLLYLFRSQRVERVFKHHNWEQAAPTSTLGLA
jgi:hypothetical protein